jgi:hypothetical protein
LVGVRARWNVCAIGRWFEGKLNFGDQLGCALEKKGPGI